MRETLPFGDFQKATILVIGHDPRLQRSMAEAKYAFFFEFLKKFDGRPGYGPHARKYDLAKAVWNYMNELANTQLPLDTIYVTNLCNKFLPSSRGGGTILIPNELALQGVKAICKIISQGSFSVIVPMSMQTFYHLCRLGFLDEVDDRVQEYLKAAVPNPVNAERGIYNSMGKAPFLEVCGQRFHHRDIPVVPVLHVKQWPIKNRFIRYTEPMHRAKNEISSILG